MLVTTKAKAEREAGKLSLQAIAKAGSALGVFGSATKAVEAKSPVASPTAAAGAKGGKRERKLGSLLGRNKNKAAPVPAEDQEEKEVLSAKQLDDKFFAAV